MRLKSSTVAPMSMNPAFCSNSKLDFSNLPRFCHACWATFLKVPPFNDGHPGT